MAESTSTTLTCDQLNALSDRLSDHADSIVNVAAHEMEQDIRRAASTLRQLSASRQVEPMPTALLPALRQHIDRIATPASMRPQRSSFVSSSAWRRDGNSR
jgi:hypothetical protein